MSSVISERPVIVDKPEHALPAHTPTVTVVIAAKNEAKNLAFVLSRLPDCVTEVVVVDGHSTDDTVEVARRERPDVVIFNDDRPGKGAALRKGFSAARGDIVVALDADGSTDPTEIPLFVEALRAGADYAKGSRFLPGGGTLDMEWYRRLGNWGLVKLVSLLHGGGFSDLCYGYNAFWRRSIASFDLSGDDGFEIETSLNIQALQHGLRVVEVPSMERLRLSGTSNLRTIPDGWRVLRKIVSLYFRDGGRNSHGVASSVGHHLRAHREAALRPEPFVDRSGEPGIAG